MNLTALVNNISVQVTALDTEETIDGRSVANLTVYDAPGTAVYEPRTPVLITDSLTGYSFSGYVNDDQTAPDANGVAIWHTLACVDETDLASKRYYAGTEWQNRYAGDIATDIVDSTLSAEGVTAAYAIDEDNGADDWQEGTQTNTAGIQTATGGALELALAGKIVTKTESVAADWNAGTLTGAMVSGNLLQLNAHPALSFSGTCSSGYGNAYAYYRLWSGSYSIPSSGPNFPAFLAYKVWINSSSPQIMAGIDGVCTDGTSIRDFNSAGGTDPNFYLLDQNRMRAHPNTDLSGFANDQWYYRYIDLSTIAGKTLSSITVAFEGDSAGTYQAYFYDVQIQNNTGGVLLSLYGSSGALGTNHIIPNLSSKVSNVGYSNIQITPVTGYEATGTRISANNSMGAATIYQSSLLSWIAATPTNTALAVYTSVDGGATYQAATNQAALVNVPLGAPLTGRNVTTKIIMSISGKDPTATPQVSNITWTVQPAYAATQTATRSRFRTQTDWNTGTPTNTVATSGGDLTINSSQRDWNDEQVTSQTLFGGGVDALQGISKRAASLRASTGQVAQSRLDFAGTWQNFTMSIDVQVPAASVFVGITYRTTFWDNNPNTEAYLVDLSTTSFNFGRGTNNATNTHFAIKTQALTLNPGEWHTITITTSGTTHNISLDGVNYWGTVTDTNFTAAGSFGLRIFNSTAGDYTTVYDNFGVMDASGIYPGPGTFSGPTWVSPSIALGSFTAGNNLIFWDATTINGDYLNIQTSFNGGTYTNATSGAAIPGIVSGTAYVSATLQVKVQMQAATAADTPALHGLTAWVTSLYNSVGNRISVPLSLAPVGTAGNTALAWQGVQPANTAILVDTSLDGTNWSNAGIGASGQAAIAGILTQSDPVVDQFSSDTSDNYTSTCRTGGTLAAWVWDALHNRLTVSGGVNAHLLYNSPTLGSNVDLSVVLDTSDNGGFVWNWLDQGDHYSLAIHDASSNNNPNSAQLYVVTGGGGGTLTPLTEYYTNTTSTTVGTAKQLSETLGTGAFTTKQSTIGTAVAPNGFGELFGAGTTNPWAASASLIAPSDNGFIDDSTALEGQTLIAGGWAVTVRLGLNLTATITADVWCRVSKRSSGGTRTIIGDCLLSNQTITATTATYTIPTTNLGSMSFATGDRLGFNFQLNVLTNANGLTGLACKIGESSIANTGITTSQVVTPGFQVGSGGATTLLSSVPITFPRTTPHAFRVTMIGSTITFLMDGVALMNVSDSTITSPGFAGLRNDNAGGGSAAQFYLFRLQFYGQDVTNSVLYSRFRLSSTDPTVTPQINQYSMSVHDPSIQAGALIPQTSYSILNGNKKTLAAIYDDLAAQSGNFWWKIISFQLFFQQHQAQPAPWVLTPQGATGVDIVDSPAPTLDNINDTYRNSQWGTGGTDIIPQTRSFVGNGTQTTFDLGFNIDSIISISLGGATQTFGIANSSTGVNWSYTQGQSTLVQDASAVPISGSSQVLTVVFNAQTTISTNVQSPSEVTRVGTLDNTTGIIDEGEDMSGLPKTAMISKCAGFLSQFGQKSKTLTYTTRRPGLAVGQLQCAFVGPLGVFAGAFLLTDIKGTWQAEGVGDGTVTQRATFAVSGVSGPLAVSWTRFIDSLGGGK